MHTKRSHAKLHESADFAVNPLTARPDRRRCRLFPRLPALAGITLLCLTLLACQSNPPEPTPAKPADDQAAAEPAKTQIDPELLYRLLTQADAAIQRDHLTYPVEGSALALYQRILAIEADQQQARRGLERVVEKYIELAMQAMQRHQYATARSMLARARIILPRHPSIEPTEQQIRLLSQAKRMKVTLNQNDLKAETEQLQHTLQSLAVAPQGYECRFIISAKNDAQGRWIYQTMSAVSAAHRLRAQVQIRLPAGVERVCYPL